MALDPSIYAAFAPKQQSAMDVAQGYMALDESRAQQQDNALSRAFNQAKFGEYQRTTQRAGALQQLQQSLAGKAPAEVLQGLRGAGYWGEADAMEKAQLGNDETRAKIGKEQAQTGEAKAKATKAFGEAQSDALKRYRGALDYIDTPQGAQRWLAAQYQDPLLSDHMMALAHPDQAFQGIPQDPQKFAEWRGKAAMGMEAWMKQQLEQGKAAETGRHNKATEGLTARGQNMADARSKEANNIQKEAARTQIINDPVQGLIAVDKGTSTAKLVSMGGAPVVGEKVASERKNSGEVLRLLDDADKLLKGATGSYAGAAADQVARFVGAAPDGAVKTGQLQAIEGALIAKMPRMEGPQSDADRLLYQRSAGQIADPTAPVAQRQAALKTVREIQTRYSGGAAAPAKPAAAGGVPPDIAALLNKHGGK